MCPRVSIWVVVLLLVAVFVSPALGENETGAVAAKTAKPAQTPQKFLLDWVHGNAHFDLFTQFHATFPDSPHKADSELFEVDVKCFRLRTRSEKRTIHALNASLLALYQKPKLDTRMRVRILQVLGRLACPESLDVLCNVAAYDFGELQKAAIQSLTYFGNAPADDRFMVFGGRIRGVVFPPSPAPRATTTLLALLRKFRDAKLDSRAFFRGQERLRELIREVLDALESHRGKEVVSAALESLANNPYRRVRLWELEKVLSRNLPSLDLDRILRLARSKRSDLRQMAASLLGWSADPKAVAPLLRLLDDADSRVQTTANKALTRLSGTDPLLSQKIERRTAASWASILGAGGEKVDPRKAVRFHDLKPGIYRFGA